MANVDMNYWLGQKYAVLNKQAEEALAAAGKLRAETVEIPANAASTRQLQADQGFGVRAGGQEAVERAATEAVTRYMSPEARKQAHDVMVGGGAPGVPTTQGGAPIGPATITAAQGGQGAPQGDQVAPQQPQWAQLPSIQQQSQQLPGGQGAQQAAPTQPPTADQLTRGARPGGAGQPNPQNWTFQSLQRPPPPNMSPILQPLSALRKGLLDDSDQSDGLKKGTANVKASGKGGKAGGLEAMLPMLMAAMSQGGGGPPSGPPPGGLPPTSPPTGPRPGMRKGSANVKGKSNGKGGKSGKSGGPPKGLEALLPTLMAAMSQGGGAGGPPAGPPAGAPPAPGGQGLKKGSANVKGKSAKAGAGSQPSGLESLLAAMQGAGSPAGPQAAPGTLPAPLAPGGAAPPGFARGATMVRRYADGSTDVDSPFGKGLLDPYTRGVGPAVPHPMGGASAAPAAPPAPIGPSEGIPPPVMVPLDQRQPTNASRDARAQGAPSPIGPASPAPTPGGPNLPTPGGPNLPPSPPGPWSGPPITGPAGPQPGQPTGPGYGTPYDPNATTGLANLGGVVDATLRMVNPAKFDAALQTFPASQNIDDRRGQTYTPSAVGSFSQFLQNLPGAAATLGGQLKTAAFGYPTAAPGSMEQQAGFNDIQGSRFAPLAGAVTAPFRDMFGSGSQAAPPPSLAPASPSLAPASPSLAPSAPSSQAPQPEAVPAMARGAASVRNAHPNPGYPFGAGYLFGATAVPGQGSGTVDKVPAMLAPHEAVLNRAAADKLGRGKIAALNAQGVKQMGLRRGTARVRAA